MLQHYMHISTVTVSILAFSLTRHIGDAASQTRSPHKNHTVTQCFTIWVYIMND